MQIKVDSTFDIYQVIKLIKHSTESELDIFFEKGAGIYENASNLLIIKQIATQLDKKVIYSVAEQKHQDYIRTVNENRIEFSNPEIDISEETSKSIVPFKFSLFSILGRFKKKAFGDSGLEISSQSRFGKFKWLFKPAAILGVLFFILTGLFYLAMLFVPYATVTINLETEFLVKLLEVKAVKDAPVNIENKTIPAISISFSDTESQTVKTTGQKTDGKKAEGEITLTNKTDDDIKIKKNTIIKLISSDDENLKYVTTEEVTVGKKTEQASESDPAVMVETFGKKNVEISAIDFGEKYNLDKGEKFEIDDYDTDELVGENVDDEITGGKLEIKKVVSQEDLDNLKKTVEIALKEKVVGGLKRKTISTQKFIESNIVYETDSASYSNKLDEESEELTLSVTMTGVGVAYSTDDLDTVVKEIAKTVVPEQFNLDGENIEYDVAATTDSKDSSTVNIQVKLKSYIFPKIDIEKVKQDLAGVSLSDAQSYLKSIQNVSKFELKISPPLPSLLMRMPIRPQNIRVVINK